MLISLSVSGEINSHCLDCPVLSLFKPLLRAYPLLACVHACAWLRRVQSRADFTPQKPSQLPQNRQNRAECVAVQRRYWMDPEGRFISTLPCPAR